MRLSNVLLIVVAACLASVNVADKTGVSTISEHHDSLGNRQLRTARIANTIDTEERGIGEVNVDILIKDALTKAKMSATKATVWKTKFAFWKLTGKTPQQLYDKFQFAAMGRAAKEDKNWPFYKAYKKYYGKGPRTYP